VIRLWWWLMWAALRAYAFTRPKFVIVLDGEAYITRWYLTGTGPTPANGFATGEPGLYLHHIHRPDADRRLHNHPYDWAEWTILRGGYVEARARATVSGCRAHYFDRHYAAGDLVEISPHTYHRIVTVRPNTWTLFRAGPKHGRGWGFLS
jgi:hypothetical protein